MKKFVCMLLLIACALVSCGQKHQHEWKGASCETPKTCIGCGETEGTALGHSWSDATCDSPKICTICQEKQGTSLGHSVRIGICSRCGNKSYALKNESDQLINYIDDFIVASTDSSKSLIKSYQFSTDKYQKIYVQEAYDKYTNEGIEALGKALDICDSYSEFSSVGDKIVEILTIIKDKFANETDNSYSTVRDTLSETIEETLPLMQEIMDMFSEWQ